MKVTCPHCNESFESKPRGKVHLSWHGFSMAIVCGLIIMGAYALYNGVQNQPLVASVTQIGSQLQQAYDVFEQVTTTVQGRVAKQIRVHIKTADAQLVQNQAKKLIEAERSSHPTNVIILYFYVGSDDAPLDSWYAKVMYVNVALIRDWNWGDLGKMKNIGPGTYLELK